jgi:hypothetical protein
VENFTIFYIPDVGAKTKKVYPISQEEQVWANPTITSYNAGVLKIYNATNSFFRIKNIFLWYKHALAY